jgi:NADP-dependent 3-hydroxy acid dehydrogenase YdfG
LVPSPRQTLQQGATNISKEPDMPGIEGKVVAITGASSGIGEATARLLAQRGARVLLGARRISRLNALANEIVEAGGSARYQALDVTRGASMRFFIDEATEAFGRIDVIVNNAGVMPLSKLEECEVNVRGVLHGIAAGLPRMRAQGSGQFVSLCANGGHAVASTASDRGTMKRSVRTISEGLRQEAGADIRVTVISPGMGGLELADGDSPVAIARAIAFAIEQPEDVDSGEIVMRSTASPC